MNSEKLKKAAREFADMETDDYGEIGERTTAYNNCIYGFRKGVRWLLTQPLSDRLTEEERAKIREKYKELKKLNDITDKMFADDTALLEWLFGNSLFNDKSE